MKIQAGDVALITGASRGLGIYVAKALLAKGMRLLLTARSGALMEELAERLRTSTAEIDTLPGDIADPAVQKRLLEAAHAKFGRIDVLVNNAGREYAIPYDRCPPEEIDQISAVNLVAPMRLSRLVLPAMIRRGRGHIVNIASMAGVVSSPYAELYVASKHGLVGFTRSLRASAQDMNWPVSASVICPGYMEGAGMYEDSKRAYGVTAPSWQGTMHANAMGEAVVRAVEKDLPDIYLMKGSPRVFAAMQTLFPRTFEYMALKMRSGAFFRDMADVHAQEQDLRGTEP